MKLTLAFLLICSSILCAGDFPAGRTVESVPCTAVPGQSYALYLPSNYDPAKKWPILYCFDASAQGKETLELFREGAEKFGYIVASSNNSRSDDPTAPNLQAMTAMWDDTHSRFSIDPARSYATGFSGGARIACDMANRYKGAVAGVIGCGAGFPLDHPPDPETPFVYFGTIGSRDFNFYEMRALAVKLAAANATYRIREFDGVHQWPPASICFEALQWMEVQAIKKKLREPDAAIVQAAFDLRSGEAQSAETAGDLYMAVRFYQAMVRDFQGLRDVTELEKKITDLTAQPAYRTQEDAWKQRDREAAEFGMKLASVARSLQNSPKVPTPQAVMEFMGIPPLLEQVKNTKDREASDHARRMLDQASAQMGFYLPRSFLERGDYDRAAVVLTVVTTIHPEYAYSWFHLAAALTKLDRSKEALDALKKSVDAGFSDAAAMESNVDLASLRNEKEFRKAVARARENAKKGTDPQ